MSRDLAANLSPAALKAEEVREHVERLREQLPALIKSIHTWLKSYGITFSEGSLH